MANEHYSRITEMLKEVDAKIEEITKYADEHGVDFSWSGPSYGMGGYYKPKKSEGWVSSNCEWYNSGATSEDGSWHASSQSC